MINGKGFLVFGLGIFMAVTLWGGADQSKKLTSGDYGLTIKLQLK
jgi:hypothetical protein